MPEDRAHDPGIVQEREDPHLAVAARTPQRVHLVDACEQSRPATAPAVVGSVTACEARRCGDSVELRGDRCEEPTAHRQPQDTPLQGRRERPCALGVQPDRRAEKKRGAISAVLTREQAVGNCQMEVRGGARPTPNPIDNRGKRAPP